MTPETGRLDPLEAARLAYCQVNGREWYGTRLAGRKLLILGPTTGYFWNDIAVISLNLTVPAWLMISGGKRCLR